MQMFGGSQRVSRLECSTEEDWPVEVRVEVIILFPLRHKLKPTFLCAKLSHIPMTCAEGQALKGAVKLTEDMCCRM